MHSFVQAIDGDRIVDRSWRLEEASPTTGYVTEAPYLDAPDPGLWDALVRWVTRTRESARFALPFDQEGADALGLFDKTHADVLVARGTIVGLHGSGTAVLKDLWRDDVRITEMDDFAIRGEGGTVMVACGIAPLVVAKPSRKSFGWSERTRELGATEGVPDRLIGDEDGTRLIVRLTR